MIETTANHTSRIVNNHIHRSFHSKPYKNIKNTSETINRVVYNCD